MRVNVRITHELDSTLWVQVKCAFSRLNLCARAPLSTLQEADTKRKEKKRVEVSDRDALESS
jgi:hypothetical protein